MLSKISKQKIKSLRSVLEKKYITQAALKFAQSLFMKLHVGQLDVLEKDYKAK